MDMRCYFVVDEINNKEVKITYCPEEKMISDFSSKLIQGLNIEIEGRRF